MKKILMCITLILFTGIAYAWPDKPVTLVIPYAAGGGTDILARTLQEKLGQELGQPVLIEYKPGGAGIPAIRYVIASQDTHKILFTTTDLVVSAASIQPDFNINDLSIISTLNRSTLVLATTPNSHFKNFQTVLKELPSNPIKFGSPGVGSISHLVLEKMLPTLTSDPIIVNYKGGNPMAMDTIGGHNDLSISSYGGTHQPFIDGGKLVAVVAFSDQRLSKLPQVPTAKELGIDISASVSNTIFASNLLTQAQIKKLNKAFTNAVTDPIILDKLTERGNEVLAYNVADSKKFVDNEIRTWSKYIQVINQRNSK